jgi:hypothetical protein
VELFRGEGWDLHFLEPDVDVVSFPVALESDGRDDHLAALEVVEPIGGDERALGEAA